MEDGMARYVALAAKRERSPNEEQELARHRELVKARLVLGTTPQTQVFQQAVSEYLQQSQAATPGARASLKRDSVAKVVELWKSLGAEEAAE